MSSCPETLRTIVARSVAVATLAVLGAVAAGAAVAQTASRAAAATPLPTTFPGIGRAATPKEVAAWDIDVRPDFRGLPKGAGTVIRGQEVWEAQCASCHGVFGESNEIFTPIVGGTTADDIRTGRVARLLDLAYPQRTTLMRASNVSTLWDYINRAMPWNAPKSLSSNDVYAVTAFILNLGGIVPENFTLSDANIAEVQARMPNRNGKTTNHGMWPGNSMGNRGDTPDVRPVACMRDCTTEPKLASFLPDHARNAHGNLALQQRIVGPQVGADTTRPPGSTTAAPAIEATAWPAGAATAAAAATVDGRALANKAQCMVCHGVDNKIVGPGFKEIARKYAQRADGVDYLAGKIREGGAGVWGPIPMPAQPAVSEADARAMAQWLMGGAGAR